MSAADFTIYASNAKLDDLVGERAALDVDLMQMGEPRRTWVAEDFGITADSYLFATEMDDEYAADVGELVREVLRRAPGDVVVLEDGNLMLRRRAGGPVEYVIDPSFWRPRIAA